MDFNFFSLNKPLDWEEGQYENIKIDSNGLEIQTSKRYIYEKTISLQKFGSNKTIKGFSVSDNGIINFIDNDYALKSYDYQSGNLESLTDKKFQSREIQIESAKDKIYVCYSQTPSSIEMISAETGSVEMRIDKLDNKQFSIISFSVDNIGTIYILTKKGMLFCINRSLNIFDKYDLTHMLNIDFSSYHKESLVLKGYKTEDIYICDKKNQRLLYINLINEENRELKVDNINSIGVNKEIVIIDKYENSKSVMYRFDKNNNKLNKLPFLGGKPDEIKFDKTGKLYIYNSEKDEITIMAVKEGINFSNNMTSYKGIYYTKLLDSNKTETLWDKITVDYELQEDSLFRISYYSFDDYNVTYNDSRISIVDFLNSKNIGILEKEEYLNDKWIDNITNPNKALFKEAYGQYMLIKVELWGNDKSTPTINKIRTYFDRSTYVKYLPEIYSDGTNDSFLDRYLSAFETFLMDIEEKIDYISNNFDADRASPEMLKWICEWLDLDIDQTWSVDKIRKLIKKSPIIFKKRGTKEAISDILEIYLDTKPIILEDFQLDEMRQNEEMREIVDKLYGHNSYGFTVIVKLNRDLSENELETVKKILDNESPAYCTYKFIILEPWMALDKHTYLGINSQILNWSVLKLDGKSILPYNAILIDKKII